MKRIATFITVGLLVMGMTCPAMAAFDFGAIQLVAYEESDNKLPVGTEGYEVHFDLGTSLDSIDGTAIDTGISLNDYDVNSWDDVYVGIFGGGTTDFTTWLPNPALFASATDDFTASANTFSQFQTAAKTNSSYFSSLEARQSKSSGTYYKTFQMSGDAPGSYAQLINAGSGFGGELQLIDGKLENAMTMYEWDVDTSGLNWTGELTALGTWTLDTTSGTLVATYNSGTSEVPLPGAVVLFSSGILGLTGLRSRIWRKK